jgi:hypothetical protein
MHNLRRTCRIVIDNYKRVKIFFLVQLCLEIRFVSTYEKELCCGSKLKYFYPKTKEPGWRNLYSD